MGRRDVSRISMRIDKSGWSFGVIRDAVQVIGGYFNLPGLERLEELMKSEDYNEEIAYIERILDFLFSRGDSLLKQTHSSGAAARDLAYKIASLENENQSFAREMSSMRRYIARALGEMGYKFSKGIAQLDAWLDEIWQLLATRNAAPNQPLMEENMNAPVSNRELEYARCIKEYVKEVGWANLPLGEREETALCLCQHLYTLGELAAASECLVDAMEPGLQDPIIYYNYFILGLTVGEYESAMQGYRVSCQALPKLSVAPSDRYQIEAIKSKDRISTTFVGKDLQEKQAVTLKILYNPPQNVRKTILDVWKKLKHPGIVEIYDFHEINKARPCIAMEYVEGPSLGEIVQKKGPIPAEEWLQRALQITLALAYAHEQGIVHGNLTPFHLLLHKSDVKITDFGLSLLDLRPLLLQEDLANFYFMAPERFLSPGPAQMCNDIYSLGKTLYYLLTGKFPHTMYQENVPAVIWPILHKATMLDPKQRYPNATELQADLAKASESPLTIPAHAQGEDLPEGVSRNRIVPLEDGATVLLPEKFIYRDGSIYSQVDNSQMVLVPEGVFAMGSEERSTEGPVHEVFLSHYIIDKYPVTNGQYLRFLDYMKRSNDHSKCHPEEPHNKDHAPKGWQTPEYKKYSEQDNCPVIFIDWWDAYAYSAWVGKSLPSEAQWEKAARGLDGRKYPWGDDEVTNEHANFGNRTGKTSAVGSFIKGNSPYGCADMSGNVWEWMLDTYEKTFYHESPRENPVCTLPRQSRVLRGGSWNDEIGSLRTTCRGCWIQTVRYAYIGLRCVCQI